MAIRSISVWTFALMALWPSPAAAAQDAAPGELTLERCIEISLSANPLWLSSEHDLQASLARVERAKAFPQPSIDLDSDLQPRLLDFRGSAESYLGLSQTIEFPGRRALRTRIARLESDEVRADRDALRAEIVFQVKEAFFSVLLGAEKARYAAQDLDLARDFQKKAEVKFEAGDIARVEVVRAGVEASRASTALTLAENQVLLDKARLNFLLGRRKFDPLSLRGELGRRPVAIDLERLAARAQAARPEMVKMKARLTGSGAKVKEAGMSYLPDLDLGVSQHRLSGEPRTWDFTLSFPVPLFFWQPLRGEVAEARAERRSLERQAEHLRNSIRLEVEQAALQAKAAGDQIVRFETGILGQAEEVYDLLLFSFQEGEIAGIELIEARRTLIEARRSYADAQYVYNLTLAGLERSVGGPIGGGEND